MAAESTERREGLVSRRKALGLTQEDLADQLGVNRSTIVRWERGETVPQSWLQPRLAKALGVSASRLAELLRDDAPANGEPDSAARRDAGQAGARGVAAPAVIPRQLPVAVPDFTGRVAELTALTEILHSIGAGAAGTVVISAIGGTAGVGKTALALHWTHRIADRFPDGQLHVNLRGFDPAGSPATAEEAIRGFLDALGMPPERIPPSPDAQAGLYRSMLTDKRMLVVLDNARDEQQARPLLPASPGSLVIITSRNRLFGLAASHGARLLSLDVLSHAEAVTLLAARIGAGRCAAEPEATAEIATRCASLPLALAIAAARATARPGLPLSALAAELRDSGDRLDVLDVGDPATSVRSVFSWSYQQLSAEAARMFRMLGLFPGPDIGVPAAASLSATTLPEARRLLRELTDTHLITEYLPGRYAFHDLLRAYADGQGRVLDSEANRDAAIARLLDHYLRTARTASLLLYPYQEPVDPASPRTGTTPEQFADYSQALAWFAAERQVLVAAVPVAAASGLDMHAWQLSWATVNFLHSHGYWNDQVSMQRTALAAVTRLGDSAGQAVCGRLLAGAFVNLGDYGQALRYYTMSLELYRQLGNRFGEAKIQHNIAYVAELEGRIPDALDHAEQALLLYRAVGDAKGEAMSLGSVGWIHAQLGNYRPAREFALQALDRCAAADLRKSAANCLDTLGYAEWSLGNAAEATACYERAIGIFREFGDRFQEAHTLTHLGDACHDRGELQQAADAWQRALAILEDLRHPHADEVRAKLASVSPAEDT
jgi:tetratricopeptide (TPR) repeat protein/DNA-binding XRE family transcriptional regulator